MCKIRWPFLILSPALKRCPPPPLPRQQGVCSQSAHLWAIPDFVPHFEALGTPPTVGVMQSSCPFVSHS